MIGSFNTNVRQMIEASEKEVSWPCINEKKRQKKKNYVNSGVVILAYSKVSLFLYFPSFINALVIKCLVF